jgi:hypothetical protein
VRKKLAVLVPAIIVPVAAATHHAQNGARPAPRGLSRGADWFFSRIAARGKLCLKFSKST